MFVRDFVQIERPFEGVAPRFLRDPAWLEAHISSASGQGAVRCERGTVRRRGDTLVVPISWASDSAAIPDLDGDLSIAPIGPTRSHVTFEATYRLPGEHGETPHTTEHAVEAAIRAFLTRLAVTLETADGTGRDLGVGRQ